MYVFAFIMPYLKAISKLLKRNFPAVKPDNSQVLNEILTKKNLHIIRKS